MREGTWEEEKFLGEKRMLSRGGELLLYDFLALVFAMTSYDVLQK